MEDPNAANRFSGTLPVNHCEVLCHEENQRKRGKLARIRRLLKEFEELPKCEQWDTRETTRDTEGPVRFGEPTTTPPELWDHPHFKTRELVASELVTDCHCLKRNGLQDYCRKLQCRGSDLCRTMPYPSCPPSAVRLPGGLEKTVDRKSTGHHHSMVIYPNVRRDALDITADPVPYVPDRYCTLYCPPQADSSAMVYSAVPLDKKTLPLLLRDSPGTAFALQPL